MTKSKWKIYMVLLMFYQVKFQFDENYNYLETGQAFLINK